MRRSIVAFVNFTVILHVAACLITTMSAASLAAQQPKAGGEQLDDEDITFAVETELILEEAVPSHKIDISTDQGVVTLSGSVDSYQAKLAAGDEAEGVKGVMAVENEIEVQPVERLDSVIRGDVVSALTGDPVTESYEIDVSVREGEVTLTGEVDSYTEKVVAGNLAEGITGVTDVNNMLTYEVETERSDVDIRNDIEHRLQGDASIDAGLITVAVNEGNVTLDGSVSSAAEKSEAETEAWVVPGVDSVVNMIDVAWWATEESPAWENGWNDDEMEEAVENALLTNPRVSSFEVNAEVDEGVATLTGTVDNLQAKQAAEREAKDTLGIWRVKNYLRVRPVEERSDTEIASDVRKALRRNPYVARYDVAVNVYNSSVHLTGDVDSLYMKRQAAQAASTVPGVVEIQNNLEVEAPYTEKSDVEIKEDIQDQLFWSPFVDSDAINVEVNEGVATLTGTVEDWDELQAAKENAREGGATTVIADLDIRNGSGAG